MKLTIKKDGNEIVLEDLSIYFKELLELIKACSDSITKSA
jgi:hypothetical protein